MAETPDADGAMRRILELALPLNELVGGPLKGGDGFMMNIVDENRDGIQGMLVPLLPEDNGKTPSMRFRLEKIDPSLLPPSQPPTAESVRKEAVGAWSLDAVKDNGKIPDAAGHGLDGIPSRKIEWREEDAVRLIRFRSEQCVNIEMPNGLQLDKGATISMWVNSEVDPPYPGLFGTAAFHLKLGLGGQIFLNMRGTDGKLESLHFYHEPALLLAPGVWRHIVGAWDGKALSLYVNGRKAGATKAVPTPPLTTESKWQIGTIGGERFLQGRVTEACIFSKALGPDEIIALFKDGKKRVMR